MIQDCLFSIDPIHVTFKGGKKEPFHQWYPYLEGYSPQFVEEVIRVYSPDAQRVLDPFGGTGTTPITAFRNGLASFYCEVNPVLQYITQTKIDVYALSSTERHQLCQKMLLLENRLDKKISISKPDCLLRKTYAHVFENNKRPYFDEDVFELVLQAKTVIESISEQDDFLGQILTVSILASLLSSSNMVRSGDIRYRKPKEMARRTGFIETIRSRLKMMVNDIDQLEKSMDHQSKCPILVANDSRLLETIPSLQVDTLITSPPYLNGTNYFRNTKIELWFLGELRRKNDLTRFRNLAISAGINNVTVGRTSEHVPSPIVDVYNDLCENAYDSRIPLMVLGYFQDMKVLFEGLKHHLTSNAILAIVEKKQSWKAGIKLESE